MATRDVWTLTLRRYKAVLETKLFVRLKEHWNVKISCLFALHADLRSHVLGGKDFVVVVAEAVSSANKPTRLELQGLLKFALLILMY